MGSKYTEPQKEAANKYLSGKYRMNITLNEEQYSKLALLSEEKNKSKNGIICDLILSEYQNDFMERTEVDREATERRLFAYAEAFTKLSAEKKKKTEKE